MTSEELKMHLLLLKENARGIEDTIIQNVKKESFVWIIDELIQAFEQQPCEDCVSIEAVIEWLKDKDIIKMKNQEENARRELAELPPVTPKPKIGHWIIVDDCEQFIAKCSECGEIVDSRMINKYPYCHCGAKMEVKK